MERSKDIEASMSFQDDSDGSDGSDDYDDSEIDAEGSTSPSLSEEVVYTSATVTPRITRIADDVNDPLIQNPSACPQNASSVGPLHQYIGHPPAMQSYADNTPRATIRLPAVPPMPEVIVSNSSPQKIVYHPATNTQAPRPMYPMRQQVQVLHNALQVNHPPPYYHPAPPYPGSWNPPWALPPMRAHPYGAPGPQPMYSYLAPRNMEPLPTPGYMPPSLERDWHQTPWGLHPTPLEDLPSERLRQYNAQLSAVEMVRNIHECARDVETRIRTLEANMRAMENTGLDCSGQHRNPSPCESEESGDLPEFRENSAELSSGPHVPSQSEPYRQHPYHPHA